jgi:hypothetical protein
MFGNLNDFHDLHVSIASGILTQVLTYLRGGPVLIAPSKIIHWGTNILPPKWCVDLSAYGIVRSITSSSTIGSSGATSSSTGTSTSTRTSTSTSTSTSIVIPNY